MGLYICIYGLYSVNIGVIPTQFSSDYENYWVAVKELELTYPNMGT